MAWAPIVVLSILLVGLLLVVFEIASNNRRK
jgi:hypothetical protein